MVRAAPALVPGDLSSIGLGGTAWVVAVPAVLAAKRARLRSCCSRRGKLPILGQLEVGDDGGGEGRRHGRA